MIVYNLIGFYESTGQVFTAECVARGVWGALREFVAQHPDIDMDDLQVVEMVNRGTGNPCQFTQTVASVSQLTALYD